MLTLQRKHDDQLSDDVCQFGNACLVEPQKVIENVDVDKNGVSGVLTLHRLWIAATDGIELTEKRRSCFSVWVEQYILKKGTHKVQIVQAETRGVRLLGEEKDDLPEVVANKTLVRITAEATKGKSD